MAKTADTAAGKLVALLEAIGDCDSDSREGLTVGDLARVMSRDKSVISRQLRPLVELGLVERDVAGHHSLGWRLFAISAHAGDQRLLLLAPPVMRRLTFLSRERVHFSLRQGSQVFTILSESPQRTVEAVGWVGRTSSITCTSAGRVLLFDHSDDEIRELLAEDFTIGSGGNAPQDVEQLITRVRQAETAGVAVVQNELDDELTAIAAPVRDVHKRIVGAINVSAPSYRMTDNIWQISRAVDGAASHLGQLLSAPPPPNGSRQLETGAGSH